MDGLNTPGRLALNSAFNSPRLTGNQRCPPSTREKPIAKFNQAKEFLKFRRSGRQYDKELPSISVTASGESRGILWQESSEAWQCIHSHHRDGFDWYLQTDDDVYVMMENLRYFMASKNKEDIIACGHTFKRNDTDTYFARGPDEELPSIGVTAKGESREILWQKSREAWQYIHDHHRDGFDWYIRTDDDAYVVMENLRYFLASKKKEDLIAYGYKFKQEGSGAYFAGGPGYVMTRPAMIRMVTQALPMKNNSCFPPGGQFEDWKMGQCLASVGVTLGDDRDAEGRFRFFPLNVGAHIMFGANPPIGPWSNLTWFEKITFYPIKLGFQCYEELPSIALPSNQISQQIPWQNSLEAWQYVHDHHRDGFDWYLQIDDNAYVVMENLKYFLASKNKEDLLAYGYKYKRNLTGLNSARRSGYVMSRPALIRMVTEAFRSEDHPWPPYGNETDEWKIGELLERVGVTLGDDRDSEGRCRFFPLGVGSQFMPGADPPIGPWSKRSSFEKDRYYPPKPRFESCSPTGIYFHSISFLQMYSLEYVTEHLRVHGMDYV
ncbi:unnamed protein product [Darwinula stevensoni]|uniref:N-acetylgalactosaminide beta-1,3-galactosyltransferase n=1 Tax=Darwinula stevensoni TaxID=69355 RepID=A0A7R9ABZ1_9CRUS|nr:unnamed protein product [Darwinula stevensoni]CAG0899523.1 unnamed protein product [Darwinula stevensoni]